ncbi:MAG: hypothetical protein JW797_06710 [Bradymonadales bacterium]|nr:hypothetical protein [Bradymonadales bacterium]
MTVTVLLATGCSRERPPHHLIGYEFDAVCRALQVCADGETVPGIDVSKWQGAIDWTAVQESGVVFAFIRVSHGTNILDEYFVANWNQAAAVGILRGAYQYFSPTQDPIEQADLLLDYLETHGAGELPPVIDVEETGGQSAATIADRVGQWLEHVEAALGVRPIIYTGPYFWNTSVQSNAFSGYPLWVANWGVDCPNLPTAWSDWVFWQTSATGRIDGISGDVDTDVFNGDIDALLAFASDPECRGDESPGTCVGDLLRTCSDEGWIVFVDCTENGQVCSMAGGAARCVDPECAQDPDGGAEAGFCLDEERLGQCSGGILEVIDCAALGQICQTDELGGRCAPAQPIEPPDDQGDAPPDTGAPDMGGGDLLPEEPLSPVGQEFGRFVQVGESGLGAEGCQVVGPGRERPAAIWWWLGILLILVRRWSWPENRSIDRSHR